MNHASVIFTIAFMSISDLGGPPSPAGSIACLLHPQGEYSRSVRPLLLIFTRAPWRTGERGRDVEGPGMPRSQSA